MSLHCSDLPIPWEFSCQLHHSNYLLPLPRAGKLQPRTKPTACCTVSTQVPKNIKHTKIQRTSQLTLQCVVPTGLAGRSGNKGARQSECAGTGCVPTAPNIWHLGSNIRADFWSLSVWGRKKLPGDEDGYPVLPALWKTVQCCHGKRKPTLNKTVFFLAWCTCHPLILMLR